MRNSKCETEGQDYFAFRIPNFALMRMRRCARRVRMRRLCGICGRAVLERFTGLMFVPRLPIFELGLENLRRKPRRGLEHEPAAEDAGPHQSQESHDAEHARERELL